ncbi:hypothetical protein [Flavobacterium piscis]|uniref:Serine protease n=1 Tax=Flavobacterium piscis TaxID=1114874 RepID=A0ABU1Y6P3_9FLAO|nr:hypothetical protein [Flavobacterium piscis]MDR7209897.1 hypothetical protein [Flavobacterium piscis]
MKRELQKHLVELQNHTKRNFKRWFKTYSGLRGVHVGKKTVKGKLTPSYSFVFHVDTKSKAIKKEIPKQLYIVRDGIRIYVPTDVVEAGGLELQGVKVGDTAQNNTSGLAGTISLYFENTRGVFLGSNMHVLAPQLLAHRQILYDVRREPQNDQKIIIYDSIIESTAKLFIAKFNGIDFGFARVSNPLLIEKTIKQFGPVTGYISLNSSNSHSFKMSFQGITSGLRQCKVLNFDAVKDTQFKNIFLTNLIRLNRCTELGDSGAPLFDSQGRIAGAMVGFDKDSSYALHIDDIIQFFQSSKL